MKIAIIGAGYVGLVTGACLAKLGNRVIIMDANEARVAQIRQGKSPIYEDGLEELLRSVRLETTTDLDYAVKNSEVCFICVNTDNADPDCSCDLSNIRKVAEEIGRVASDYLLVVVKSTVIAGTTEEVIIPLLEKHGKKIGKDIGLCVNPEFLRAGNAVRYFLSPDRIIIGETDEKSGEMLSRLYEKLDCPRLRVSLRTAELIKYASNAFLATKISFINEIGNLCKEMGIDAYEVARAMGYDKRIGPDFLRAGVGFGGSCLPKDTRALVIKSQEAGIRPELLEAVLRRNDEQPGRMISLLKKHLPVLKGRAIGILGVAFKADTDDVRASRAVNIVHRLLAEGAVIKVYDPVAMDNFREMFPQLTYTTPEEILKCEAVLILTDWLEFENLDYQHSIVIDGRRIVQARKARIYEGLCW